MSETKWCNSCKHMMSPPNGMEGWLQGPGSEDKAFGVCGDMQYKNCGKDHSWKHFEPYPPTPSIAYICGVCSGFAHVDLYSLDTGSTFVCAECNGQTVVELHSLDHYIHKHDKRTVYIEGYELRKCPNPGCCSRGFDLALHRKFDYVYCTSCGLSGPTKDGHLEDAVADWNSLPR